MCFKCMQCSLSITEDNNKIHFHSKFVVQLPKQAGLQLCGYYDVVADHKLNL